MWKRLAPWRWALVLTALTITAHPLSGWANGYCFIRGDRWELLLSWGPDDPVSWTIIGIFGLLLLVLAGVWIWFLYRYVRGSFPRYWRMGLALIPAAIFVYSSQDALKMAWPFCNSF